MKIIEIKEDEVVICYSVIEYKIDFDFKHGQIIFKKRIVPKKGDDWDDHISISMWFESKLYYWKT
jgi:hypothetical protein